MYILTYTVNTFIYCTINYDFLKFYYIFLKFYYYYSFFFYKKRYRHILQIILYNVP